MTLRDPSGWQLILADLSLILFLVTISALADTSEELEEQEVKPDHSQGGASVAPSQALFRPGPNTLSIEQWLAQQPRDPRATLSVVATHRAGEDQPAWEAAQALATQARKSGVVVRVLVQPADRSDLYASLAFDAPR